MVENFNLEAEIAKWAKYKSDNVQPPISTTNKEQYFIKDNESSVNSEKINLKKRKNIKMVLLVEDNLLNKELTYVYLRDSYNLDHAIDGPTAIKLASERRYDAILMDINLKSSMDGIEAAQNIKKIPGYSDIPIAAVTGYTSDSDKRRFLSEGCSHYLGKPFDRNELISLLNEMILKDNPES